MHDLRDTARPPRAARPPRPTLGQRAAGTARACAFLALVWAAATTLAIRAVRADVDELMLGFGAEMMRYDEARQQSAPRGLTVNGAALRMSSGMADGAVRDVLDHFEARCGEVDGELREQLDAATDSPDVERVDAALVDGTLREESEERGYVACFDLGRERLSPDAILARVEAFLETGDLSRVGHFRYVFARRAARGTHFVQYWADGPLNVYAMFPRQGDVPGADVPGVPRPPGSRRVLHAAQDGEPYGFVMFADSPLSTEELLAFYRRALPEGGFRLLEDGSAAEISSEDEARGLVAERGDELVTLVVGVDPEGRGMASVLSAR